MERPSHLVRAASSSDTDFENGNSAEGYLPKADFYKVEAILSLSLVRRFVDDLFVPDLPDFENFMYLNQVSFGSSI
jgi:hypothetical protein